MSNPTGVRPRGDREPRREYDRYDDEDYDDYVDRDPRDRHPRGTPPTRRPPRRPTTLVLASHRRRAGVMLVVTLIAITIFIGRLVDLQVIRGGTLAAEAMDQRLRTVELVAHRGSITDVNGVPLAVSMDSVNVTVDQTLVADPATTAAALAPELGISVIELQASLTGDRRFAYVAKNITPDSWRRIDALSLPGIYPEQTTTRSYPVGGVTGNVLGFVGSDGVGIEGLEYSLNDVLAGVNGTSTFERGAAGPAIPNGAGSTTDAVGGATVRLTIDRDIQYVAQRVIADAVAASGAESGTVVVLDPRTGQILALATVPTVDSNKPGDAAAENRGDRAVNSAYEPGSTAKIMTMAALLNEGVVMPTDRFEIPPTLTIQGKEFHDNEEHGTLNMSLTQILAQSSNIGTILAAQKLPSEATLYDYQRKFGVGESTHSGLPGESAGLLPAPEDWSGTTFPTLAFGQGLSLTPLQSAVTFATIANGGVRVQPSIVADYTQADGTVVLPNAPQRIEVVSEQTATTLTQMMKEVVSDRGTAPLAEIPGYQVAGKTGTAQFVDPTCGCYNGIMSAFNGFAPADNPALVIGVSVVRPKYSIYGLSSSVFRQVMSYALQVRQIPPTSAESLSVKPNKKLPVAKWYDAVPADSSTSTTAGR